MLTIGEFERGVAYWRGETNWDRDFHNAFYEKMAAANPRGSFSDAWWGRFLPTLRAWRATRPRGSDFLTSRARARFAAMSEAWESAVTPNLDGDISSIEWSSVSAFPTLVAEIKDVDSPVFTSKFCHFLAPRVFPLVDTAAMGNPYETYQECFLAYRSEWMATTVQGTREELVSRLARLVGSCPAKDYPFKNKVVELCLIGRNHV